MHGVILYHFRQFAIERHGTAVWDAAVLCTGLQDRDYAPGRMFPDGELEALLGVVVVQTGVPREALLEHFGRWVVPCLMKLYRPVVPAHWDAVQFMLHLEERIHQRVIRRHNPTASPPLIDVVEVASRVLEIRYRSHRRLSALAVGGVHGVADWYGERAEITTREDGEDGQCRFVVRLSPAGSGNGGLRIV